MRPLVGSAALFLLSAACQTGPSLIERRREEIDRYNSRESEQEIAQRRQATLEAERREAERQQAEAQRQDAELQASLAQAEKLAKGAPGEPREAFEYTLRVIKAYDTESVKSGRVELSAFTERAAAVLDLAGKADKTEAPAMLLAKGTLWKTAGKKDLAEAAFRASLSAKPNLDALLALLQLLEGRLSSTDVKTLCKRTRPNVLTDEERFALLEASLRYGHSVSVEGGLSWTSVDDLAWYKREVAARAEQQRQAEDKRAEEEQRRRAREAEAAFRAEHLAELRRQREEQRAAEEQRQHDRERERQERLLCLSMRGTWEQGLCMPPKPKRPRVTNTDCSTDFSGNVHCTSMEH